jgi:transcriptional regulator with XRE-family HTH domain
MAEQKIFAGPRIRRIRNQKGLTQTAMAEGARHFAVLSQPDRAQSAAADGAAAPQAGLGLQGRSRRIAGRGAGVDRNLREVFADPLLSGELPGDQELIEIAEAAPNAAAG